MTDSPWLREYAAQGSDVLFSSPGDAEALLRDIDNVFADDLLAIRMGSVAAATARGYTFAKSQDALRDLLKSM